MGRSYLPGGPQALKPLKPKPLILSGGVALGPGFFEYGEIDIILKLPIIF